MSKSEIRLRCWITLEQQKFFGPGRVELLNWVEKEGSVSKAAKKMGMSYKKAWDMIHDLNTRGQQPFVTLRKGGRKGGGAEITTSGKQFLNKYAQLLQKLQTVIEEESEILRLL
ncbi:winged helix-turn-helix domain-containing protein [Negadavirga shengliensis]|uniref:Winged helix-turn-helix domain-containing protein n=1 Tax=Negadavirga shengliensis TaxID=1389218 RepID=A0ABV9SVP6_9BACT